MIKIENTHDIGDYINMLYSSPEIYIDNVKLINALEDAENKAEDYRLLTLMWLRIESSGSYVTPDPDSIIDFLDSLGIDLGKFYTTAKTGKLSLDLKRVVTPLIERKIEVDLLENYKAFRTNRSYSNFLRTLANSKVVHYVRYDGSIVLKYPTTISEQENYRVYYSDIAVVSIPKKYSNIICGKDDDTYIAWCDYPQADWRFAYNLFIKDNENSEVMQKYEDSYEGLVRLIEKEEFDPERFTDTRADYKVNCLKVFYNSKDNKNTPTKLREFYRKHPRYRKYLDDLYILYKFKVPIPCISYFGYEQMLPVGRYSDAFVAKGLNTPIQTFTSHVVIETVYAVLDKFWALGYTKEDINVYFVRHDEPIFQFKRTILKDAWIFEECSEIFIDGFTPIHLQFSYGKFYKEEDPHITKEIESVIAQSGHMISKFEHSGKDIYYNPVPSVEKIYARMFEEDEGCRVWLYDYRTDRSKNIIVKEKDTEGALLSALESEGLDFLGNPKYLLVLTGSLECVAMCGEETFVKVINEYDRGVAERGDQL